jgi:hypothetical protein
VAISFEIIQMKEYPYLKLIYEIASPKTLAMTERGGEIACPKGMLRDLSCKVRTGGGKKRQKRSQ